MCSVCTLFLFLCALPLNSGLKTTVTAAVTQTGPPVTHHLTAATPPVPLQMTATAAVTAMMTALPHLPLPPPLCPQTAQTQEAAAIQIKDPQRRRKRRNEKKGRIADVMFL